LVGADLVSTTSLALPDGLRSLSIYGRQLLAVTDDGIYALERGGDSSATQLVPGDYQFGLQRSGVLYAARHDRVDIFDMGGSGVPQFKTYIVTGVATIQGMHEFAGVLYLESPTGLVTARTP